MEGPRAFFLIVLILFYIFTPDQPVRRRSLISSAFDNQLRKQDFDVLTNSSYGDLNAQQDRWLNLTGFKEEDSYQWTLLPLVKHLSRQRFNAEWSSVDEVAVYSDVTSEIRGKFSRSVLSRSHIPNINLTAIDPSKEYASWIWEKNITESRGDVSLSLHDDSSRRGGNASEIKADIALWSESAPGNGWQTTLRGVHFSSGSIVLSSYSSKFDAIPAIPHFTLDGTEFEVARPVMNETLKKYWTRRAAQMSDPLVGAPACELIVWLQPKRILPAEVTVTQSKIYLADVERELSQPEGAPIGVPPPLSFSSVIFSPDCGYVLESGLLAGPKIEAYESLAGRLLLAFIVLLCMQIILLKRQMEKATTPSTRSRIAYHGIVIVALGDGLILFAMIALLMLDEAGFLIVAGAAFLSCIHVAFLEVKFVFDIWTVQVGDPARAEAERQRRTNPVPLATANELPLPATTPRTDGATPIILTADQDTGQDLTGERASFAAIYSRFYFTLVCLMFFSLWAMAWPRGIRSIYANTLAFGYLSFWWPQIYRNVMRNCRKALTWEYVIGSSMLRMVPVLYWYFAERNILAVDTSSSTGQLLFGWLCLQISVLVSQQFLGPRLLVKDSWCPPAYDYHPVLRDDDVEGGGMSIGLLASASEAKDKDDKTRKTFDCAICMNEIDVPFLSRDERAIKGSTWLEQRNYMVTPCRHIFHTECLEGWMNLRLVCPVCRESLPPL